MKHLFSAWENIKLLIQGRRVIFFFDFDGTLAPIAARPSMVKMAPANREIVRTLAARKDVKVVIISGRELKDIKKHVGIPGILYVGNHGLEIEGPRIRHVHPSAEEFRQVAEQLVERLRTAYAFMPEVFIEEKVYSVSVHYRQVAEDKIEFVKMVLLKEITSYLKNSTVTLLEGKKVWEIRPATQWNKGKAVLWLLARLMAHSDARPMPVYAGDDVTDEDAFTALKRRGITIKVTEDRKQESAADYYVESTEEIFEFLKRLKRMWTSRESENDES